MHFLNVLYRMYEFHIESESFPREFFPAMHAINLHVCYYVNYRREFQNVTYIQDGNGRLIYAEAKILVCFTYNKYNESFDYIDNFVQSLHNHRNPRHTSAHFGDTNQSAYNVSTARRRGNFTN